MTKQDNIQSVARINKLLESRDEVVVQLAGRIVREATNIYNVVGSAEEHPSKVLADAIYTLVDREVKAAVALAKADAERDYQAKLDGFRAAIERATAAWK